MSVWSSMPPPGTDVLVDDPVQFPVGPEDQDGLDERADHDDLAAYRRAQPPRAGPPPGHRSGGPRRPGRGVAGRRDNPQGPGILAVGHPDRLDVLSLP